MCAICLANSM